MAGQPVTAWPACAFATCTPNSSCDSKSDNMGARAVTPGHRTRRSSSQPWCHKLQLALPRTSESRVPSPGASDNLSPSGRGLSARLKSRPILAHVNNWWSLDGRCERGRDLRSGSRLQQHNGLGIGNETERLEHHQGVGQRCACQGTLHQQHSRSSATTLRRPNPRRPTAELALRGEEKTAAFGIWTDLGVCA